MKTIKVYKTKEEAELPKYATRNSACFDLKVFFKNSDNIKIFNKYNESFIRNPQNGILELHPMERALLPSGLIFDIPDDYSLRLHVRSSTGGKMGISLANSQGIVDPDYVEETFFLAQNNSQTVVGISSGDRLFQGEFVKLENKFEFEQTIEKILQKTDRNGGFGSTN